MKKFILTSTLALGFVMHQSSLKAKTITCPPLYQDRIDETIDEDTEVINLKDNFLPKGLTPLEDLFDLNDIPRKPKMEPLKSDIEECNIGTKENPKYSIFHSHYIQLRKGDTVSY